MSIFESTSSSALSSALISSDINFCLRQSSTSGTHSNTDPRAIQKKFFLSLVCHLPFPSAKITSLLEISLVFFPRYNIAPSQDVPVIVRNENRNELRRMHWGLVPSWSQDRSIGQRMINARSETLLEKPSFKQLVATQRCLVPADGFYEWRREGNRKVPMWLYLKSRKPFAFPGLWDRWLYHHNASEWECGESTIECP